jgi:4-hydroxybenzoate polyprenyltransferase
MPGAGSSTISWPISGSSCTSEGGGPLVGWLSGHLGGLIRLAHPFPSLLNAAATLALSLVAGGGLGVGLRLAAAMLALQASIGAVNDFRDAPFDLGNKPGKPLPRGVVRPREAVTLAGIGLAAGLLLAAPSGGSTVAIAIVGVGLGYLYDLGLSRTAWSWLPLSAALPLVPVFAWVGSTGTLPGALVALVPLGTVAGGGLALANGLADLERDEASGIASAAVRLGPSRAWLVHAVAIVAVATAAWSLVLRTANGWIAPVLVMAVGSVLLGLGIAAARSPRPIWRERGWELEAIGVAAVGLAWLGAIAGR